VASIDKLNEYATLLSVHKCASMRKIFQGKARIMKKVLIFALIDKKVNTAGLVLRHSFTFACYQSAKCFVPHEQHTKLTQCHSAVLHILSFSVISFRGFLSAVRSFFPPLKLTRDANLDSAENSFEIDSRQGIGLRDKSASNQQSYATPFVVNMRSLSMVSRQLVNPYLHKHNNSNARL
jgi:hypothetical protein